MNEQLTHALEKGETLLWSGSPASFDTFSGDRKTQILRRIIINLAITAAILLAYILATVKAGVELMPVLIIVIIAIGCYAAFSVLLDAKKIPKLIYDATDRRILVLVQEKVTGIPYDRLGDHRFITTSTGEVCFVAGEDLAKCSEIKMLKFAPLGILLCDGDKCRSCVLYAISEPELFREAVKPYLP